MNFLKSPFNYTGSKYPQLEQLYSLFPKDCNTLVDLFTGGGSVFVNSNFKKVVINDVIKELSEFYIELYTKPFQYILDHINQYIVDKNDKNSYLQLRQSYNSNPNCYKLFVLCSSCTNNMMRFNNNFKFNQTFGKRMVNDNTIKKLYDYYLKIQTLDLHIYNKNYYDIDVPQDAFVYLDPPYLITQAGYNCYWNKTLQNRLYDYIIDLDNKGIKFGISNMLYHKGIKNENLDRLNKFNFHIMQTFHNKAKKQSKTEESVQVFICNY